MTDKKKILILCDAFGPPSYVPRVRNLCVNMQQYGWQPHICTEKMSDVDYTIDFCPACQVPIYFHKGFVGKLEWVLKFVSDKLFNYKEKAFYKRILPYIQNQKFDLIFCSVFNLFPLITALRLAKQLQVPLVIDLRDIVEQCPGGEYNAHSVPKYLGGDVINALLRKINIKRRNKVLWHADALISVSPWHKNLLQHINAHSLLIYNGFDADVFYPENIPSELFRIVYTGRIYGKIMQNPDMFFEAMGDLAAQGKLNNTDTRLCWYVNKETTELVRQYAERYHLQEFMEYSPYIAPAAVPNVLHTSSIALVFSNKASAAGSHGIMTTKFFEALGVEKPVLCVRSDEECLAAAITETNAGLAATNVEEVKNFIMEKYAEWKQNGFTRQAVNREMKNKFSRQEQAKQFVEIFNSLINKE